MKVLFQIRPDFLTNPAGDSMQMVYTKRYLSRLGVEVDMSTVYSQDYKGYDLVHLFNLTRVVETYAYSYKAYEQGIPIVLSTIYWDNSDYYMNNELPDWKRKAWHQQNMLRKIVLSKASILLPNSQSEAEKLIENFETEKPYHVVPNCVDRRFSLGDKDRFYKEHGLADFALCVGRISPRKNQLALIEALEGTGIKLVLIGPVNDRKYGERCKKAGKGNVVFIPGQSSAQLRDSYAAAAIHVLPSWFETPGLSNLEAAAAACPIATTEYGCTQEYFGELACYCLPDDIDSIRQSILQGLENKNGKKLQEHVLSNYTWERAAGDTLTAYKKVLEQ
ncbi:MAG: glycosyltransferase family 4 protein [Bacillota bacterium]|nr:glycosyltransferase family 4 protein [Bacillota bacterium]MDD3298037.1 glycosyltransferase family 4 protein [Bacillota bacterium]MDD3850486.1 glycosyltransferase family 4 protein [Bacillota bacterium]MDD4707716.1 glycosyltransferase family 4 protein [Bacillota bacterium]